MAYSFVDRILECTPGESVSALKALALNEEFFRDHFPGMPVLPGAMILEGFVQAARHCLAGAEGGHDLWELAAVGRMKFNRFAVPGDVVQLDASRDKDEEGQIWFSGRASIDGKAICQVRFALRDVSSP